MPASVVAQVGTRLRLFGVTNQNSANELFGDVMFYDKDGATILQTGTAYVHIEEAPLQHLADAKGGRNQAGHSCLRIFHDQRLQCDFRCIPEGASIAEALNSIKVGPAGCFVRTRNFPVVPSFDLADIFNSENWLYEGGASIVPVSENVWGFSFTATRYYASGQLNKQALR